MNRFDAWMKTPIHIHSMILNRCEAIELFVTEGLVPFIESHGYQFARLHTDLTKQIADNFYKNNGLSHIESEWDGPSYNIEWKNGHDLYADDKLHYHHVVGWKEWESFWKAWGAWRDVSPNSFRGQDRRQDIEHFVWGQLDLDLSEQSGVLDEILKDEEDAQDTNLKNPLKRGEDIYLRETEGWGGYRR